jgi:hypothetical protein
VVVNCDLPWNPAKLEQRIARAWRKNQSRPVTVVNLIAEETIEHRMLGTRSGRRISRLLPMTYAFTRVKSSLYPNSFHVSYSKYSTKRLWNLIGGRSDIPLLGCFAPPENVVPMDAAA